MTQTPKIGALAVVVHAGQVLLAQRSKEPDKGLWGFPGGHVEWGETVAQAAIRELREETGITARPLDYLDNLDLIVRDGDGVIQSHYLLVGVACRYLDGKPQAADDAMDARWFSTQSVLKAELPMSAKVPDLLQSALSSGLY